MPCPYKELLSPQDNKKPALASLSSFSQEFQKRSRSRPATISRSCSRISAALGVLKPKYAAIKAVIA
ncbi:MULTISPECIES: hypothetical protein [unclassified Tolypothrix]|uniref:hypothetical protein n=1 Tax=unclassified Tolypothrix TaxID=2649714 RepID=UPI0012D81251|nr:MULTISPECIES: hypothetical protein [unclassified Tolypothrix]MBE9087365.1 hypothetical protein [Tolypothrix sp. LEGE 11397]UYD28157.1 hypothetical protein HGR01_09040 [Tolypothrix sp. PCC 7712]UYD35967.1 hypothetical protein HG267_09555 [Tolypothrix sp. PCC 7601]